MLTEDYFNTRTESKKLTSAEAMAQTAYRFTFKQKKLLASANVANSIDTILSTLPF